MYAPPEAGPNPTVKVLAAVVVIICLVIGLMAVLYVWAASFLDQGESTPIVQLTVNRYPDSSYRITVVKVSQKADTMSYQFFVKNESGDTVVTGKIEDHLWYAPGQGKAVSFEDSDWNGRLSSGDAFLIMPGEPGSPLEHQTDLSGYIFELEYYLTGDIVASKKLP